MHTRASWIWNRLNWKSPAHKTVRSFEVKGVFSFSREIFHISLSSVFKGIHFCSPPIRSKIKIVMLTIPKNRNFHVNDTTKSIQSTVILRIPLQEFTTHTRIATPWNYLAPVHGTSEKTQTKIRKQCKRSNWKHKSLLYTYPRLIRSWKDHFRKDHNANTPHFLTPRLVL